MSDLTAIEDQGQFARTMGIYFRIKFPKKIIETGLYHGKGSTSIIASLIRDIPIPGAEFCSIECNRHFIQKASENLEKAGLRSFVKIIHGLSIPKFMLPSSTEIDLNLLEASNVPSVKLDHAQDPKNAAKYYQRETESFEHDDVLGRALEVFDYAPDFVLLDSGGHVGTIEFKYLLSKLKAPCAIALDDTRHFKHYESRKFILNDKRFEVINDNDEKYGSMIVKFTPL